MQPAPAGTPAYVSKNPVEDRAPVSRAARAERDRPQAQPQAQSQPQSAAPAEAELQPADDNRLRRRRPSAAVG